jgi:cytochrome P450
MATSELTYDPFDAATNVDPYPIYRRLLSEHPLYYNPERDLWVLSRFVDVQAAVNDAATYSSSGGVRVDDLLELVGPSPLTTDPPRHGLMRNVLRPLFAPRVMRDLEPTIAASVQRLLDRLDGRNEFDVAKEFAKLVPVTVICHLLGVPVEDAPMLKGWADAMLETVPGSPSATPVAWAASAAVRAYWLEALEARRSEPRKDILTAVAAASTGTTDLSVDEQVGMCNLVFEAGNATTGSLISNALLALAGFEEQKRWLAANPDGLPGAVEEFVRWESPVQSLLRTTTREVEIHDTVIPAGARVMLQLGAANRDPSVWDDPDRLDLSRPPKRNLGFGEGIHFCIGAPLARLEAPAALSAFLSRYPEYSTVSGKRFHDVALRTLDSLVVRVGR